MANNERFSDPEAYLDRVRKYFQQGITLKDQIAAQQLQLQCLTSLSYSPASPGNISGDKVQTSPAQEASFEKNVEKKTELEEKLRKAIDLMIDLKQQMICIINQYVVGIDNRILTLRYVEGLKIDQFMNDVHYSAKQIKRRMDKVMSEIILPDDAIWINWRTLI